MFRFSWVKCSKLFFFFKIWRDIGQKKKSFYNSHFSVNSRRWEFWDWTSWLHNLEMCGCLVIHNYNHCINKKNKNWIKTYSLQNLLTREITILWSACTDQVISNTQLAILKKRETIFRQSCCWITWTNR